MDTQKFLRQNLFKLPLIILATLGLTATAFAEDPYMMVAGLERMEASGDYQAAYRENREARDLWNQAMHTKNKKDKQALFDKMALVEKNAEALKQQADDLSRLALVTTLSAPQPEPEINFALLIPLFMSVRQNASMVSGPATVVPPPQILDLSALPATLSLPTTTQLK